VTLEDVERALTVLSRRLDLPYRADWLYPHVVLALGHRARTLFQGFSYCFDGPVPVAALTILRPLIEINILLRFLRQHPEHRALLWVFERHRWAINVANDVRADPTLLERLGGQLPDASKLDEWQAEIDRARAAARNASVPGVPKSGPLLPTVAGMVQLLADPAATEAYVMAYRRFSGDIHGGVVSFDHVKHEEIAEGWARYTDVATSAELRTTRRVGASTFASTLVIVARELDMNIEGAADRLRAAVLGKTIT
jgi:hypothetical protein